MILIILTTTTMIPGQKHGIFVNLFINSVISFTSMKTINPILIIPCPLTPTAPPHLLRSASIHSTVTLRIGHPSRTWPPYKIHFKVLDGTFIEISLWGKKLHQTHIHTINQCPDSCRCDNQLWQRGNACSHWVQLCWCLSNFHQHNF